MNWTSIVNGLEAAANFVNSPEVSALAALGGASVEGTVKMVQGIAAISSDLVQTAQSAGSAIASGDLAQIMAFDATIQAQNTQLAQQVDAS